MTGGFYSWYTQFLWITDSAGGIWASQLKEFAESRHIDISGAKTKFEVVAAISEAVYESE